MPLQIRRGTNAERLTLSQPFAPGELLYVTDDKRLYVGDGTTLGGVAVTGYTDEDARDASAALFTNGSHTGISFTYNDVLDTVDATVNFSDAGTLVADAFQGSVFADDSTLLIDAIDGTFNLDGTIKGNIVPITSEEYDLGSSLFKFKELYLSGNNIFLGDASITASGSAINLPVGSTVGGIAIGLASETLVSDLLGSVIGEDSTILVDATSNSLSTGRINVSQNVISTPLDILVLSGSNIAGGTQSQVVVTTLSAPTLSSINDALDEWAVFGITAHKDSVVNPGTILDGEILGVISLGGFQPTAGEDEEGDSFSSQIGVQVDRAPGTASATFLPTKIFLTNEPATEGGNASLMTFDSFGRLAVNQENAQATLDVNGFAKLAILTAEPASPANGMIAIADGASWDPLSNGRQSMVVRLGGAWVEIAAAAP